MGVGEDSELLTTTQYALTAPLLVKLINKQKKGDFKEVMRDIPV